MIEHASDNPEGYFRLGVLQRMQQQYDLALANFEKALSLNPQLMDVFSNLVLVYAAQTDFTTAITKCDQKIAELKNTPSAQAIVYNLKAELYLAQANKEQAEESLQAALKANPNYLQPYYALARISLSENKAEDAIAQYRAALDANPEQADAHMLLGVIYDRQKQFDLSEKHYRAALDINPEFAPAANNLAFILAEQNKSLDEALKFARLAKGKLPNNPNVMDTLGWVYYKKGLYEYAILEFTDALEKMSDNATVNYHLGMAFYKKGDTGKAREHLEKALQLDRNFPGADEAKKVIQ
jgi:tetratricopeptide (TPR) repeat protein